MNLECLLVEYQMNIGRTFQGYTDEKATNQKIIRDVFKRGDLWYYSGEYIGL